ncbi:MAG TPA: DUF2934 domain-containing protein [Bryobacteraceae bacterium]
MQSNKASKKTRVSRSSQAKIQETNDISSLSHRHKATSEPASAPVEVREPENQVAAAALSRTVSQAEVADLAYTYFAARGYEHGHAEEDWLRAERELRSAASA